VLIPHVVLLGAGASKASFPSGDRNGKHLPLMKDIIATIGLQDILHGMVEDARFDDFEELYSSFSVGEENKELLRELERRIHGYFSSLKLPDEITIYDKLILSLRGKDIIATFNWDPLLLLSYRRCGRILQEFGVKLPEIVFLHGNVAVGICEEHKNAGFWEDRCPECLKPFRPVPLLYPVTQKDYSGNPFIRDEWSRLKHHLSQAYFLTTFGYSAPTSDVDAMSLMKNVWKENPRRKLAEIEIIDTCDDKEALRRSWDKLIVSHHYRIKQAFEESYIYRYPRRSIEAFFDCFMQCEPWRENPLSETSSLNGLVKWLRPLFEQEINDSLQVNWGFQD
jgi:hypothetical protein